MEHAIARLRAPEVATRLAAGAALILPMGSTETHGPAAPMGDYLLAEAIAMQAARALAVQGDDALVAPGIAFGGEDFFAGVPGAIALSPATLTALTLECLEALHRGAPGARLLVVNGHGGNIASIDTAQRAMRARHGVVLPALHLWREAAGLLKAWGRRRRPPGMAATRCCRWRCMCCRSWFSLGRLRRGRGRGPCLAAGLPILGRCIWAGWISPCPPTLMKWHPVGCRLRMPAAPMQRWGRAWPPLWPRLRRPCSR